MSLQLYALLDHFSMQPMPVFPVCRLLYILQVGYSLVDLFLDFATNCLANLIYFRDWLFSWFATNCLQFVSYCIYLRTGNRTVLFFCGFLFVLLAHHACTFLGYQLFNQHYFQADASNLNNVYDMRLVPWRKSEARQEFFVDLLVIFTCNDV